MVVLPFKTEDPGVATRNLTIAAGHPRVRKVLAVGAGRDLTFAALEEAGKEIGGADVSVVIQDRIGDRRPGKGDGMNTGLRHFLESGLERLHFYDADITNFDPAWIDRAESAADAGFPIVRHYFPRASTDAMITWMVTRPIFAIAHPGSILWEIRQPLGGELLITHRIAESLVEDPFVTSRSDWGIDTAICYTTAALGEPIRETYVADGKQHALYGSLEELRDMVVECFEAARDVADKPAPPSARHEVEGSGPAPAAITDKVGYNVEDTLTLLTAGWTAAEVEAASTLPSSLSEPLLGNLVRPVFAFLDAAAWHQALISLLELYRPEPGWRGVLFRLWVARVLAYTTTDALAGHSRAMQTLESTVSGYTRLSGNR